MTKEALDKSSLGKYLPTNMPKADKTDGNCVSSNEPKHFSGHQHQFRSGQGSVKAWLGQNYKDLKRQSKRSGMLFEDPEFPASNHLLTDDNQTLISYFGRSRIDSNSIQWLRPHEICQISNRSLRPKMFVGDADRFDINQGEIGNCWFLAALANLAENKVSSTKIRKETGYIFAKIVKFSR